MFRSSRCRDVYSCSACLTQILRQTCGAPFSIRARRYSSTGRTAARDEDSLPLAVRDDLERPQTSPGDGLSYRQDNTTAVFENHRRDAGSSYTSNVHKRLRLNVQTGAIDIKHIHPHGRIRGKRGKELRESSAQLDIKSLGRESDIIVLREAGLEAQDEQTAPPTRTQTRCRAAEEGEHTPSPQDIIAGVHGIKTLTHAEVRAQLEELREKYSTNPDVDYAKRRELRHELLKRYSKEQLYQYASDCEAALPQSSFFSSITKLGNVSAHWRSLPHGQRTLLDKPIQRHVIGPLKSPGAITSRKLAHRIVNTLWAMQDEQEVGEMEVSLSRSLITLLNSRETQTILEEVSQARGVELMPVEGADKVRIMGTRAASYEAVRDINARCLSVVSMSIDVAALLPQTHNKGLLRKYLQQSDVRRLLDPHPVAVTVTSRHGSCVLHISAFKHEHVKQALRILYRRMHLMVKGDTIVLAMPNSAAKKKKRSTITLVRSFRKSTEVSAFLQPVSYARHVVDTTTAKVSRRLSVTSDGLSPRPSDRPKESLVLSANQSFHDWCQGLTQTYNLRSSSSQLHDRGALARVFLRAASSSHVGSSSHDLPRPDKLLHQENTKATEKTHRMHSDTTRTDKLVQTTITAHLGELLHVLEPPNTSGRFPTSIGENKKAREQERESKAGVRKRNAIPHGASPTVFKALSAYGPQLCVHLEAVARTAGHDPTPKLATAEEWKYHFIPSPISESEKTVQEPSSGPTDTSEETRKDIATASKAPLQKYPRIELRCNHNVVEGGRLTGSFSALLDRTTVDIGLPHAAADLSIRQERRMSISIPESASPVSEALLALQRSAQSVRLESIDVPLSQLGIRSESKAETSVDSVPYTLLKRERQQSISIRLPQSQAHLTCTTTEDQDTQISEVDLRLEWPPSLLNEERVTSASRAELTHAALTQTVLEDAFTVAYVLDRIASGQTPAVQDTLNLLERSAVDVEQNNDGVSQAGRVAMPAMTAKTQSTTRKKRTGRGRPNTLKADRHVLKAAA